MTRMSPAHPCVLPARSVHNRDTGTLLASSLGAGIPTTGAVRTDAPTSGTRSITGCVMSCRRKIDGADASHLPVMLFGGLQS